MRRKMLFLAIAGLVVFGLLGAACQGDKVTVSSQPAESLGIRVMGEGDAFGAPDVALLTLGVSTLAPTVKDARARAADAMKKVVDSLKSGGVDEKDIQTTQFSIYPEYDYPGDAQRLLGYRVTNTVVAKVRDIDKTGDLLDAATAAGGDLTQVQDISFTIEDPDELRDEARKEAVEDAKTRAERLAELSGVDLGKVVSISESFSVPPLPYDRAAMGGEMESVETPIQPGELEVTLTVEVLYAIE